MPGLQLDSCYNRVSGRSHMNNVFVAGVPEDLEIPHNLCIPVLPGTSQNPCCQIMTLLIPLWPQLAVQEEQSLHWDADPGGEFLLLIGRSTLSS